MIHVFRDPKFEKVEFCRHTTSLYLLSTPVLPVAREMVTTLKHDLFPSIDQLVTTCTEEVKVSL